MARSGSLASVLMALLLASPESAAVLNAIEEAYEGPLRISMSAPTRGEVVVTRCEGCEEMTLRIDENTRLFVDGEELPIAELGRYRGRPGVVFHQVGTERVSRIKVMAGGAGAASPSGDEK